MKLLVTGGRDYINEDVIYKTLETMDYLYNFKALIHGGCRGVDTLCKAWFETYKPIFTPIIEVLPEWDKHGKAAGPVRNEKMIVEHKPDYAIAFPGGKGTANMLSLIRKYNIDHIVVRGE